MKNYLQNIFNFKYPYSALFYSFDQGIRFQISDPHLFSENIELCFQNANWLASEIICNSFSEDDPEFHIILRHHQQKRSRISKNSKILKIIKSENNTDLDIHFFKSDNANREFGTLQKFASIHSKFSKILIENIVPLITANEMCPHKPKTSYKIFFISKSTNTIIHYYDDRGLDLISLNQEILSKNHNKFHSHMIEYKNNR